MIKRLYAFAPRTKAELTVYWFLRGNKHGYLPTHFNCRCVIVPIEYKNPTK